ncbi:hypothetical protein JVU11DRAFT_8039 [Chiua virens]|nr:hypothetical protein JVU11DRAFT_8039 [Chiua virens]
MRKLLQLFAYIQDSPLSSGDIFLKSKKEPRPVCSSIAELTSQALRNSPSCASFLAAAAKPRIHPAPEELSHDDTMSRPVPSPSIRSSSEAKDSRHAKRKDSTDASSSVNSSRVSNDTQTVWSPSDIIPSPCQTPSAAPADQTQTTPLHQPPTFCGPRAAQLVNTLAPPCSPRVSLDLTLLDLTLEHTDKVIPDSPPLTRSPTLASSSDTDGIAQVPFEPSEFKSAWGWKPPTSWTGPPATASTAVTTNDASPARVRSFKKRARKPIRSDEFARTLEIREPEDDHEDEVAEEPERPLSPGIMVFRCAEDGWQEKHVAEVIPMLRALKFK